MLSGGIDHPRCFEVRFQRTLKFIIQPHHLLRQGFQVREIFADTAPIFQDSAGANRNRLPGRSAQTAVPARPATHRMARRVRQL